MRRRPGLLSLLISLFALNAALCPCDALRIAGPADSPGDETGHSAHHMAAAEMVDETAESPDCHTDSMVEDCGMPDASDAETAGKPAHWQPDPAQVFLAFISPASGTGLQGNAIRSAARPHPSPPSTPLTNRDRLLI